MPVVLIRIDDRLVHGQVIEGWLKSIRATHIVVASDAVAQDETQKALYLLAVPQGIRLSCLTLAETALAWRNGKWKQERVLILVSSPKDVLSLLENGITISSVNVGGLHFREGRVQVLKAVSLDDVDVAALKAIADRKVFLEARPLPLDEPIDLARYLKRWQQERMALEDQPR